MPSRAPLAVPREPADLKPVPPMSTVLTLLSGSSMARSVSRTISITASGGLAASSVSSFDPVGPPAGVGWGGRAGIRRLGSRSVAAACIVTRPAAP